LTWDELDDDLRNYTQASTLAGSFQRDVSARSSSFFTSHEDLLALLRTLLRPDMTTALPSILTRSGQAELPLSEQENEDQGQLAQAVAQSLQTGPNWIMVPNNAGVVVLVVLNGNVCPRPSSLPKRIYHRQITQGEDCCEENPAMQGSLRQRQGA
jgi:hypothetical protein